MIDVKNCRCLLFMPANNPAMLLSSDVLDADAVILDLEDSVSLVNKDAARILLRNALKSLTFSNSRICIRINPTDSPYWLDDLNEIICDKVDAIVFPKASVEGLKLLEKNLTRIEKEKKVKKKIPLILLIESPVDLLNLEKIVSISDRVIALAFGAEDYATYMGIKRSSSSKEIEWARFLIATFAKAHNLSSFDTPYTDISNFQGLREDSSFVKSIGFTGKLSINPRHVEVIQEIFSLKEEEIQEALIIIKEAKKAKEEGLGVFSYKGKMVDLPVIERANNIIRMAKLYNLLKGEVDE